MSARKSSIVRNAQTRRRRRAPQPEGMWQALSRRVHTLGALRDGILVGVAIVYGAGYAVWSLHAWRYNMGILPALDFQYFVAGIVPALIGLAALWLARVLWRFVMHTWPARIHRDARGGWQFVRLLLKFSLGASLFAFMFVAEPSLTLAFAALVLIGLGSQLTGKENTASDPPREVWRGAIGLAVLAFFGAVLVFGDRIDQALFAFSDETRHSVTRVAAFVFAFTAVLYPATGGLIDRFLKPVYFVLIFVFLPLIVVLYYVEEIYPSWPQELGGGRPRCALVEAVPGTWADRTQQALLPSGVDTTAHAIRSNPMQVLYANDDVLLVRAGSSAAFQPVYELKKSDLNTIVWCKGTGEAPRE